MRASTVDGRIQNRWWWHRRGVAHGIGGRRRRTPLRKGDDIRREAYGGKCVSTMAQNFGIETDYASEGGKKELR